MVEEDLLGHLTTYWWAQLMRKEATQRCGAALPVHGRLGALRPWELRLIESNVKLLCQCLCWGTIVNGGWFGAETDRIECETALPVLVSGYEVNGGWFGAETDRIECETASPVLVS